MLFVVQLWLCKADTTSGSIVLWLCMADTTSDIDFLMVYRDYLSFYEWSNFNGVLIGMTSLSVFIWKKYWFVLLWRVFKLLLSIAFYVKPVFRRKKYFPVIYSTHHSLRIRNLRIVVDRVPPYEIKLYFWKICFVGCDCTTCFYCSVSLKQWDRVYFIKCIINKSVFCPSTEMFSFMLSLQDK